MSNGTTTHYAQPLNAARILDISVRQLRDLRARGTGPVFMKVGRNTILYPVDGLHAWVEQRAAQFAARQAQGSNGHASPVNAR